MATQVLTNAFVSIGGVDLSDHVKQVTLKYSAEEKDFSAMGDTAKRRKAGLYDWELSVQFYQDYAASKVDATLFPLVGTQVAVILRPDAGVVGTTNPQYTGNGVIFDYSPLDGTHGDDLMTPVTIHCSDGSPLARATA